MKILVVDDELVSLAKTETIFSAYGQCDTASDGLKAIGMFTKALVDKAPYDIISIDIEMPDITGLETLERFNRLETMSSAPAAIKLVVSGQSTSENVTKAGKLHCAGFLVKPITAESVAKRLQEYNIFPAKTASSK